MNNSNEQPFGGDFDRATIALRVTGANLDPRDISAALRVEPTFAAAKGEVRLGGRREITQPTGVWVFEFEGNPAEWTPEDAIKHLLTKLPTDLATWHGLASQFRVDIVCGLQMTSRNRGLTLSHSLLTRLAERHIDLDFDIYFVGAKAEEETDAEG